MLVYLIAPLQRTVSSERARRVQCAGGRYERRIRDPTNWRASRMLSFVTCSFVMPFEARSMLRTRTILSIYRKKRERKIRRKPAESQAISPLQHTFIRRRDQCVCAGRDRPRAAAAVSVSATPRQPNRRAYYHAEARAAGRRTPRVPGAAAITATASRRGVREF